MDAGAVLQQHTSSSKCGSCSPAAYLPTLLALSELSKFTTQPLLLSSCC
jgi:hypothetical protein